MTFEEITRRLQNVKPNGANKILASCPCQQNHKHGDRNRSLSATFDPATGKILLYCFTGCRIDEICAALDITQADLNQDARAGDPQRDLIEWYGKQNGLHLDAVYSYCYGPYNDGMAKVKYRDPDGKKTFRWIHADAGSRSGYKMGQADCKHRLYCRGDLTAADVVFLVEGEKDADTVYNLFGDMPAVCTENGAGKTNQGGKWRDEYTAQLAGQHVYILFDNDEPGRAFAEIEAAALQDAAAAVYILDITTIWEACPDGGDITDLVNAAGAEEAVAKLSELAADARPRSAPQDASADPPPKSAIDLFEDFIGKIQTDAYKPMKTGMPDFDRLLGGGILRQSLLILSAAPGTGKTTLAQQIFETAAADGTDVIFLNLEMSREQLLARSLSRIAKRQGRNISAATILQGYSWTDTQKSIVQQAADEYRRRIAPRMQYNPAGSGTDLASIEETITAAGDAAKAAGRPAPVVVLDYLHLVTSAGREDQSEIIKKTVAALKRYAMKYDSYVFAISANNRPSINSGIISQTSGRDTSAIEYSADYQLSLNYRAFYTREEIPVIYTDENGIQTTKYEKADASNPDHLETLMQQHPRQMYVQVLKCRMNEPAGKLFLAFDAANSTFTPIDTTRQAPGRFTPLPDADDLPDQWKTPQKPIMI